MTRLWAITIAVVAAVAASTVAGAQGWDKKTIEKMLGDGAKKLASANQAEREQGAEYILGYITCAYRQQYMPMVVKATKDTSPKVRVYAAQTLEKIAAKEAIPDLVVLLDDPVDDVRERAAYALGTIGDPSAVPGLSKARDTAKAQGKTMISLTMQEGIDEITGKSPTEHTKCP